MRDLGDHPAHFSGVLALGHAIHLAEAEGFERLAHFHGAADAAADLAETKRTATLLFSLLRAHASPSAAASTPLPRSFLYCSSLRSCLSASNVALTTLCGFAVPSDLVRMF